MYQANAFGLLNVVSVASPGGHVLDAIASRAYAQVGNDHAPGPMAISALARVSPRVGYALMCSGTGDR
jgi:hypothetical protein